MMKVAAYPSFIWINGKNTTLCLKKAGPVIRFQIKTTILAQYK